ncbi:hypothetical protein FA95DRAFT_1609653 [Auriscalpium vulgare]|uniref:Uncharacterized protein n=1 Tax=Auriscalpium vulgare TaxID=40419 RepID=A0ACB8RGQ6_9AGAM|nr:hypothetical protein FA95DRAFT_1609653 [Auriscalpium vulgare]
MRFIALVSIHLRHFVRLASAHSTRSSHESREVPWSSRTRRASFGTRTLLDYDTPYCTPEKSFGSGAEQWPEIEQHHFIPPQRIRDPPPSLDSSLESDSESGSSSSSCTTARTRSRRISTPASSVSPLTFPSSNDAHLEPLCPPPFHYARRRAVTACVVAEEGHGSDSVSGYKASSGPMRFPF